jgi:predicted alpha/beta superfamily hydrolase
MPKERGILLLLFSLLATGAMAGPADVAVLFTNSIPTSGNTNVFVVGSLPPLGNWDVRRAVKLVGSSGVWSAAIGIPEGTDFEYKFIRRATSPDSAYGDTNNVSWEQGPNQTGSTAAGPPAPYQGRSVFYYSNWSSVSILYSNTLNGQWTLKPMSDFGPGRKAGERVWRVDGLNRAGDPDSLVFVFTDGIGQYDNPPADSSGGCLGRVCVTPAIPIPGSTVTITYTPAGGPLAGAGSVCLHLGWNNWATVISPDASMTAVSNTWVYSVIVPANATQLDCVFNNCASTWDNNNTLDWHFGVGSPSGLNYETPLDACVVQDKQIYNYWPPATVGPSRVELIPSNASFWPTNGLAARSLRIYLPRGYDQNTTKRYPVLYMHDGQNIFYAQYAGSFGCWYTDTNANNLIRFGKMRETIIVGVDNSSDRFCEYDPPGCNYTDCSTPRGSAYVSWIADRVRPYINAHYRTLADRENTGALGSSLGGLISAYMAWDWSNVFTRIGCFSSSFQVCMPFPVPPATKRPVRIYLDAGTSGDGLTNTMTERDRLIRLGYVLNMDLDNAIGVGDAHNEDAWKRRSPQAFRFLFPTSDEPNTVLDSVAPMQITGVQDAGASHVVTWTSYLKRTYTLQASTNEEFSSSMNWSNLLTSPPEVRYWNYPSLAVPKEFHFLRIRQNTVPDWPN